MLAQAADGSRHSQPSHSARSGTQTRGCGKGTGSQTERKTVLVSNQLSKTPFLHFIQLLNGETAQRCFVSFQIAAHGLRENPEKQTEKSL